MRYRHATVSRRFVLFSGLSASLLAVSGSVSALGGWRESVLSGRLTDEQGAPMRNAHVEVAGFRTRTDGDGRFFMQGRFPERGHLSLQITGADEGAKTFTLSALPERIRAANRDTSHVSLVMPT